MKRPKLLPAVLLATASLASSRSARAFDSKGHVVIEALAYQTLVEGHGDRAPAPEVLRDLINDGALAPPLCFGDRARRTAACRNASVDNPLLEWPQPRTDRPDAAFRRQFSDPGQCYHFMATLDDEASPPLEGSRLPRALATTAVVRCRSLLDELLRQVVVTGGAATRESGRGLYELMHSVTDSFSFAHTERTETHAIAFLRTWEPVAKLAGGHLGGAYSMSPTRHASHDFRDTSYVRNFAEVGGRPCAELTDFPYDVPFACLSTEGDLAREALVDLLLIVHRLRLVRLSAGPALDTHPEQSAEWQAFKERWFTAVTPCRGAECDARQPAERVRTNDLLLGLAAVFNPTRQSAGAFARAMLLKASWDLNPFVYGVGADVGAIRHNPDAASYFGADLELDLLLPVGKRFAVGLAPVLMGYAFGTGAGSGPQVLSQLMRVDTVVGDNLWVEVSGPAQLDWITGKAEWSLGLTLGLAPSAREVASDRLLTLPSRTVAVRDETWSPSPLWYGRIKGHESSWYVVGAATPYRAPSTALPGQSYGDASVGAAVLWNHDPWGERYPTAYGGLAEVGLRHTTADFRYLTAAAALELRWYPVHVLGVSLVPARIEGGFEVSGAGADSSPDVRGSGGGRFFAQVGTRIGVAFTVGLVDLLVQAPTLDWSTAPWSSGEILSFRFGIHL